jgi:hypothetical protein
MVSITILALIALMISRIFSETTRAVERGNDRVLLDETARVLLDVIEQDLSQALIRTNVAFRVHAVNGTDALYFVSPGARRKLESLPRDTAPMRLRTKQRISSDNGLISTLHLRVITEQANGSSDPDSAEYANLLRLSDYYYTDSSQPSADFNSVHGGEAMGKREIEYTAPLEGTSGTENHAMVSFMSITINNNPDSNRNHEQPADVNDLPRFVDVTLGLVSSTDMAQAMRLYTAQGQDNAWDHLDKHEQIYTRRIFMRNTGADHLSF